MKLSFVARLSCFAFLFLTLVPAELAAASRRIVLPEAGHSTRLHGTIRGLNDRKCFLFEGSAGTSVKIELSGPGPLRGVVFFPSGGQDGAPGGVVFDRKLPDSGQYRLEVTESSMGDTWAGNFSVTISVAPLVSTP